MRGVWGACVVAAMVAGCASAGGFGGEQDANGGKQDAARSIDAPLQVDARLPIDAGAVDAEPVDAKPIDAAPPDACVPQTTELLANPTFDLDAGGTGWTQQPIQNTVCGGSPCGPFPLITSSGPQAQSAPYFAFLGGITGGDVNPAQDDVTDQLFQDVAVPANTTELVLTGYYLVGSTEDPDDPNVYDTGDVAVIQTNGTPLEDVLAVSNLDAPGMTAYVAFTHQFTTNLSAQTVRLRFTSTNDSINNTNFFFDTMSLQATHCP